LSTTGHGGTHRSPQSRRDAAEPIDTIGGTAYREGVSTSRPSADQVRATTAEAARSMIPQNVPVNAYETAGAFVIVAPFPAVTCQDVSVQLTPGGVRFWAELRSAGPRDYAIHEWEYGGYERSVGVPAGFGAGIEASLTNGQLVVRVLSGEFTAERRIQPTSS
jgi:HSP20 family molecular chaperone IbpA